MSPASLLFAGGVGFVLGADLAALILLPIALLQRLNQISMFHSWACSALCLLIMNIGGGQDPVLLSACSLVFVADLARQQPCIPPEALVVFGVLVGLWMDPVHLSSVEAAFLLMVLGSMTPALLLEMPFIRSFWPGALIGGSLGLLVAEVWLRFFS